MLTLYQRTDCPFCWKVRFALCHLELGFDIVEVALGEKHPKVMEYSPSGTVPVLVDDDQVVWESAVALEYLDARYAPGVLYPREAGEAARVRLLHTYSDKLVGSALRELVFEKRSKIAAHWDVSCLQSGREKWLDCQAYLNSALGQRPYFGATLGAADCALAARCGVAEAYGEAVAAEFGALSRWYEGIKGLDSWKTAYPGGFIRKQ